MNHRSPAPAPRTVLLAVAAALAATALAHLVGWGVAHAMDAAHTAPDANIGAGMALLLLPFPLAPVMAWPLVWAVRLPRPGITALVCAPVYLVLAVGVWTLWPGAVDRVPQTSFLHPVLESTWSLVAANAVILAIALATAALIVRGRSARAVRS
ncbi:transporter [Nocardiopsis synnemataformans]|uniref:transporter n=1 Tax=Nocardiopsis synnemataformans TaxID=61305 RepID=UPI003EB8241E